MYDILMEWAKKPGSWLVAILLIAAFLAGMDKLGAPIPKPVWASQLETELGPLYVGTGGVGVKVYEEAVKKNEDRLIELKGRQQIAPEADKNAYKDLIQRREKQLKKDQLLLDGYRRLQTK